MILANLRERITAADVDLVVQVLAAGNAQRERTLWDAVQRDGIDRVLDVPGLPARLQAAPQLGRPSAALFIYVTVRHALRAAGVDDVRLSDYVGALVLEFGLRDRAHRIARFDDAVYRYLVDIVADAHAASGRRAFLLHAHLGNYSLWLAGIFPDYIAARRERKGAPGLQYYEALGARGFRVASDHRLARDYDLAGVFERAAASFPAIRIALNGLSDRLWFPGVHTPARLLRQVGDAFGGPAPPAS